MYIYTVGVPRPATIGMFYWLNAVQPYNSGGWNYISELPLGSSGQFGFPFCCVQRNHVELPLVTLQSSNTAMDDSPALYSFIQYTMIFPLRLSCSSGIPQPRFLGTCHVCFETVITWATPEGNSKRFHQVYRKFDQRYT